MCYHQISGNWDCSYEDSKHDITFPGENPNVITVGGTTQNDQRHCNSCYGPALDVMAPYTVHATDITGDYGYEFGDYDYSFSGTSAAAPQVAGLAGLILSIDNTLTQEFVRKIICATAQDINNQGFDEETGWGRINAYRAAKCAAKQFTVFGNMQINEFWWGNVNIVGDLTIPNGVKLEINSGTSVNFAPGTKLTVNGTLIADGVRFEGTDYWKGIKIINASNSTKIKNCVILNFGVGLGSDGIYIEGCSPLIDHNTITGQYNGIKIYGGGSPTISYNNISWCSGGNGITIENGSNPNINYNTIAYNFYHGISIYNCNSGILEVHNNELISNGYPNHQYNGIRVYGSIINAYQNKISDSHFGIYSESNSEIDFGSIYGTYTQNNLVQDCHYGLVAYNSSDIVGGLYYNGLEYHGAQNSIRGIANNLLHAYQNSTIEAKMNWLGSNNFNIIQSKIFCDNNSTIMWEPFLEEDPFGSFMTSAIVGSNSVKSNESEKESKTLNEARLLIKIGKYSEAKYLLKRLLELQNTKVITSLLKLFYITKDLNLRTYFEDLVTKYKILNTKIFIYKPLINYIITLGNMIYPKQ